MYRYKKRLSLLMAILILLSNTPLSVLAQTFESQGINLRGVVVSLNITPANVTIKAGETTTLVAALSGSSLPDPSWCTVTWESSSPSVAAVQQAATDPMTATVTAGSEIGMTNITCKVVSLYNGLEDVFVATAAVNVIENKWNLTVKSNYPSDAVRFVKSATGTLSAVQPPQPELSIVKTYATDEQPVLGADFSDALNTANYTIIGYNTAPNGTGDAYSVNETLSPMSQDLTLYAQWEKIEGYLMYPNPNAGQLKDPPDDGKPYIWNWNFYLYYWDGEKENTAQPIQHSAVYFSKENRPRTALWAQFDPLVTFTLPGPEGILQAAQQKPPLRNSIEKSLNQGKTITGYRIRYGGVGTISNQGLGSTIYSADYDFNSFVGPIKPHFSGWDFYCDVYVAPIYETLPQDNQPAEFIVLDRSADGTYNPNDYFSYNDVGTGFVNMWDAANNTMLTRYGTSLSSDVSDRINKAPTTAQVADRMNIQLLPGQTVRWFQIRYSGTSGYQVLGIIQNLNVWHTISFVNPLNSNATVLSVDVQDGEDYNLSQAPGASSVKMIEGKVFQYWSLQPGGVAVTQAALSTITKDITLYAVYRDAKTVFYQYAENQPDGFPAKENRQRLPKLHDGIPGTAITINPPSPPAEPGFYGEWVLPTGSPATNFDGTTFTMPDANVQVFAQYRKIVSYTVQQYYEQEDGTYAHDSDSDRTDTAVEGDAVSVTENDKNHTKNGKYVLDDTNANKIYSTVLSATDPTQNILKVYYKKVKTTLTVVKNWTGTGALPGADATFKIERNAVQLGDLVTLSDTDISTHQVTYTTSVFTHDDAGNPYTYTVTETTTTPGYTKTNNVEGNTYTFTNAYDGSPKDVTVILTWDLTTRTGPADPWDTPASVSMELKRNGAKVPEIGDFFMTKVDNLWENPEQPNPKKWKKTFTGLPMYAPDGTAYEYTVEETIPGGYVANLTGATGTGGADGVTLSILNKYTGGLKWASDTATTPDNPRSFTATKTFIGGPQMTVDKVDKLLALQRTTVENPGIVKIAPNNVLLKSVTDEGNNVFEYTWGDTLWSYDAYGNEYIYKIVEIEPDPEYQGVNAKLVGDIATIDGSEYNVLLAATGVTNEYIVPQINVTGSVEWDLTNAESGGGRVPQAYVSLYRKTGTGTESFVPGTTQMVGYEYVEKNEPLIQLLTWPNQDGTDGSGNSYTYVAYLTDANGVRTYVPGYAKQEEGRTIKNTYDGVTKEDGVEAPRTVTVDKAWVGAHADFEISAKVTLLRQIPAARASGTPYAPDGQEATITVSTTQATALDGVAEVTWSNLPRYFVSGMEYVYSVVETPITVGYVPDIVKLDEDLQYPNLIAYQITNTYSPALSPVTATIEWRAVTGLSIEGVTVPSIELPLQRRVGTNDWQTATDAQGQPLKFNFGNQEVPAGQQSLTVSKTWENLPVTCACGRNYEYRIHEETAPNGYLKSGEGLNLTNTYNGMSPGSLTMSLTVRKKWAGLNAGELRPVVYMNLYRNDDTTLYGYIGYEISLDTPEDGSDTLYVFDALNTDGKLLRYAPDGAAYTYTVTETDWSLSPINGYTATNPGAIGEGTELVVTNTRAAGEITYTIIKQWQDAEGTPLPPGTEVPAAKFMVLEQDEETFGPGAELTQYAHTFPVHELTEDTLSYEFTLPQYSTLGVANYYYIQEVIPNGYTATAVDSYQTGMFSVPDWDEETGLFINKYDGNTNNQDSSQSGPVGATLKVQWKNLPQDFTDVNNLPNVTLYLKQNDTAVGDTYEKTPAKPAEITYGQAESQWDIAAELLKYAMDGTEFAYTVDEKAVPNGYEKSYSEDGKTVINTYTGGVTEAESLKLKIEKSWEDVPVGTTLPKVQLSLYQNDRIDPIATGEIASAEYTAGLTQTFTFSKDGANNAGELLPKYDPAGNLYTYTVKETPINGYYSSLTDTNNTVEDGGTLSVTNTYDGESNYDYPVSSGLINISLTNMTGLMVDKNTYPDFTYTLTRRSGTQTNWIVVLDANNQPLTARNSDLTFTGGDNQGKFTKMDVWKNQLQFAPDGTAYQYSVNTAHGQTTILNNGVDAPNALDGYVSLYSKDDHLAGGWAPGQRMVEVQHIPEQGVLKLTNEYQLSGQTVDDQSFFFELEVDNGGFAVIDKTAVNGYYQINSGETVYITGVKHGATLTVTEKDYQNYTMDFDAKRVDGETLDTSVVNLSSGKLTVVFNPAKFNTSIGLQVNVVLTNKQGELALKQSFVGKDQANVISDINWPVTQVHVKVTQTGQEPQTHELNQTESQKIIRVPYGKYTVTADSTIAPAYDPKVFELNPTEPITPTIWAMDSLGEFEINADNCHRFIRVVNLFEQPFVAVTVRKEWVDVPAGALVPQMQFRLWQHQVVKATGEEIAVVEFGVPIAVPSSNQSVSFGELEDEDPTGTIDYWYELQEWYNNSADGVPNGYKKEVIKDNPVYPDRVNGFKNTYNGTYNNADPENPIIETVTVSVTKTWKGLREGHEIDPGNATFKVYRQYNNRAPELVGGAALTAEYVDTRDGAAYEQGGIMLVDNTAETVSVGGLPRFAPDGTEYVYSVLEEDVSPAYVVSTQKSISEGTINNNERVFTHAFTVTNTYQPGSYGAMGAINFAKKWENIPADSSLLPTITVTLKDMTDGGAGVLATIDALTSATANSTEKQVSATTVDENGYTLSASGEKVLHSPRLAKYRPDGKEFVYQLVESTLDGYEHDTDTSVAAAAIGVDYLFTNTYQNNVNTADAANKVTVEVNKTWKNVPDGATGEPAVVTLYQNGKEFGTKTLTFGANNTPVSDTWTLLKYAPDGSVYSYTVKETPAKGYKLNVVETSKDADGNSVWAITNTYDGITEYTDSGQEKNNPVTLTVKNNWTSLPADAPVPNVTFKVYNDENVQVGSVTFVSGTSHQEEETIENLKRYKPSGGEPYTFYGVQETVPNGYELKDGGNVVENTPDPHQFIASDGTITVTNNFKNETTSFTVEIQWKQGTTKDATDDMASNTPVPNVLAQLRQSVGTQPAANFDVPKLIQSGTAQSDTRTAKWTNLPVYDTQGNAYVYSAVEITNLTQNGYHEPYYVGGDGTDAAPYIIRNVYNTSDANKYTLSGTKTWTGLPGGASGADCSFRLLYKESNSTVIKEITGAVNDVSDGGSHTATLVFNTDKVPIYAPSGEKYLYQLVETVPNGYEAVVQRTVNDTNRTIVFEVTNNYTGTTQAGGTASVTGKKLWAGVPSITNPAKVAPVTLRLFRAEDDGSGTPAYSDRNDSQALSFNSALEASATWAGLAYYAPSGNQYLYQVREIDADVPKGYVRTVDSNNANLITNTYKELSELSADEKVNFTGAKVWAGLPAANAVGAPVRLQLKQSMTYKLNGEDTTDTVDYGPSVVMLDSKTAVPGEPDTTHGTSHTWTDLPKYALNGTEYTYSVVELRVPNGYTSAISTDGTTVTNTYDGTTDNANSGTPDTFTATIKWMGIPEDEAGATVDVQLKQTAGLNTVNRGSAVPVSDTNSTTPHENTNKWENLPKFAPDSSAYVYSVALASVPNGYTAEISADGKTITITYDGQTNNSLTTPLKQTLELLASKTWGNIPVDETGADVTLRLKQVLGQTITDYGDKVLKDDGYHYTTAYWDALPKYALSGDEYEYFVREVTIPKGYAFSQTGNSITNTFDGYSEERAPEEPISGNPLDDPTDPGPGNTAEKVTVNATKTWVVDEQTVTPGSMALPTIYLQLKRAHVVNGEVKHVDDIGNPKELVNGAKDAQWTDLYRYAPDGTDFVYTVHEVQIPKGYKLTQTGYALTNTYDGVSEGGDPTNPGGENTATVSATLNWLGVPQGMTKPNVDVQLWQNGVAYDAKTMRSGDTIAQWTNLAKYAPDGKEYTYTVSEVSIPKGYYMEQDGWNITNVYNGVSEGGAPTNLPTTDEPMNTPTDPNTKNPVTITATKSWADVPAGAAVPTIQVQLWQNGVEHSIVKAIRPGDTTVQWENLAKYAPDGEVYKYTVSEVNIPQGYYMVQNGTAEDGFTITNTYDGLSEGGTPNNLPTPGNYTTNPNPTDPGGKSDPITITATKEWKNVPTGVTVPTIEVQLWQNGSAHGSAKEIPAGSSTAQWTGLDKYSPEGKAYIYTVSEVSIPMGFAYTQKGYKLTNTYDGLSFGGTPNPPANPIGPDTPNTEQNPFDPEAPGNNPTDPGGQFSPVTVRGTKSWKNVPEDATLPEITVRLYQNGKPVNEKTLAPGKTEFEWTDLVRYSPTGKAYIYTVSEKSIPKGYSYQQMGYNLTNTYDGLSLGGEPTPPENPVTSDTPNTVGNPFDPYNLANNPTDPGLKAELLTITATKVWENVPAGSEVPDIAVRLYRNGLKVEEDKIIAGDSNSAVWTGLDVFGLDGEEYQYTVSEVSVPPGFNVLQSGTVKDGFTITNTRIILNDLPVEVGGVNSSGECFE